MRDCKTCKFNENCFFQDVKSFFYNDNLDCLRWVGHGYKQLNVRNVWNDNCIGQSAIVTVDRVEVYRAFTFSECYKWITENYPTAEKIEQLPYDQWILNVNCEF